jgi:prolipoprotein diacylglyceryltransferase
MEPSLSISRMGFRKWYERQLIDAHLSLVTCILCLVLTMACIEAISFQAPLLTTIGLMIALFVSGYGAFRSCLRYHRVMTEAWRYGEQAVCKQCSTYGRLKVLTAGATTAASSEQDPDPAAEPWMNVACKKCGHTWRMPE